MIMAKTFILYAILCVCFNRIQLFAVPIQVQNDIGHGENREMNTASLTGSCKADEQRKKEQSNMATSLAEKAAKDAKAASEAQQPAAQQAALQVKVQLAEQAEAAAEAAEAALIGKGAMVNEIESNIQEAENVLKEESSALPDAQQHVQTLQHAEELAVAEVKGLQVALTMAQQLIKETDVFLQGVQEDLRVKQEFIDQAKQQKDSLQSQLNAAETDLTKTHDAESKAMQAANDAKQNVDRNIRTAQSQFPNT